MVKENWQIHNQRNHLGATMAAIIAQLDPQFQFLTSLVCMVSSFGICEWIIVGCLLCLAGFFGKFCPQTWHPSSAGSQALAVWFVCILTRALMERTWSIHRYPTSVITAPPAVAAVVPFAPACLNWSVSWGLEFVREENYSGYNEAAVLIQHLTAKMLDLVPRNDFIVFHLCISF